MKICAVRPCFVSWIILCSATLLLSVGTYGQRQVSELSSEVDGYIAEKTKELLAQGKRLDPDKREDLKREKKSLAARYASEVSSRTDLKEKDFYYLGLLYIDAEDDINALEAMKRFLSQYPPETKGDMIQSARSYAVMYMSKRKLLDDSEKMYQLWVAGSPINANTKPWLEQLLAVGFFKDGQFDKAIKYGQEAFDFLKTLECKTRCRGSGQCASPLTDSDIERLAALR